MSQVVVNFLVNTGTIGSPTFTQEPRVFDFEISGDAQAFYTQKMTEIQNLLQNNSGNLAQVSADINELYKWSQLRLVSNGVQTYQYNQTTIIDPNNPPPGETAPLFTTSTNVALDSTMDANMAQSLDQLVRTLRAAGWDPILSPVTQNNPFLDPNFSLALNAAIQTLAPATADIFKLYGVFDPTPTPSHPDGTVTQPGVIASALSAAAQARLLGNAATGSDSLQQLLMVDYVSRGNEMLFNDMNKLKEAIDLNQSALSYLNSLQDLMNQKDPQQFILQLQYLNGISNFTGNPQTQYDNFEEQTYNQALGTVSKITAEDPIALQRFLGAEGNVPVQLRDQVNQGLNSGDPATTLQAIKSLINIADPTALANYTPQQLTDLQSLAASVAEAAQLAASGSALYIGRMADINSTSATSVITTAFSNVFNALSFPPLPPAEQTFINNTVIPLIATPDQLLNRERFILTNMQLTTTTQSLLDPLVKALRSVLSDTLNISVPPGTFAPTAEQINILFQLAGVIAQANQQGGISGLESNDPTTVQNALTTAIQNLNPTLAADTSFLPTWLPIIAQRYAALHGPGSTALSAGAFTDLSSAMNTVGAYSKQQIINNLTFLINQIVARTGSAGNGLSQALQTIKNDLSSVTIKQWIEDASAGADGDKQRHLSNAITSSESFNDTQREELRRVMFTFEEFYKSATSLLSRMTQLIEKMAGAIAR